MKHQLSLIKEVCQRLQSGFLYSTICACVALLVFALLAFSCVPALNEQSATTETVNTTAEETTKMKSAQSAVSLPEAAAVDLQKMPYIKNAFKRRPSVSSRSALDDFHTTARRTVRHSAVVANCSFDVLKAFVAKGWSPIVIVRFEGRTPEILPISDYNDQSSMVSLQNPTNLTKRRLPYKDFETSWTKNSRNKCVLITPQQLTEKDIRNALSGFLPTEAFQEISVRNR